jgi:predicted nucleotidyltransferase
MLTEIEVQLVELLDDPSSISGILLHGSWSRGRAHPESDFDLICVLRASWENHRRAFKPFQASNVDVYYASIHILKKRLQASNPFNNNFVLNAFVDGKVLVDRDGTLAGLIEIARAIWVQGPPRPTTEEIEFSQTQFQAAFSAIERSSRQYAESLEQEGLIRLRCSELFSRMIYEYCRRKGIWATSMVHVLNWLSTHSSDLHSLARQYLISTGMDQSVDNLRVILKYMDKVRL